MRAASAVETPSNRTGVPSGRRLWEIERRSLLAERRISRILLDADDIATALPAALRVVCETHQWEAACYWQLDASDNVLRLRATWRADHEGARDLPQMVVTVANGLDGGSIGRVLQTGLPLRVPGALLVPVALQGTVAGVVEINAGRMVEPHESLLQSLDALGHQLGSFCAQADARNRLREKEEHYENMVELAAIGISHVDADGRFIHVNRELCKMLGYTSDELLGLSVRQISHPDDRHLTDQDRGRLRTGEVEFFKAEKRYLRKDGTPIWVALTVASKRAPDGRPLHDVSIVENITSRREAQDRVQYLASHDAMTGLPNRTLFGEFLARAIERARRYRRRFAVLFIDLDRFKIINDSLGHECGDELLKTMATRFGACLRSSDVVARFGGDEFVALVEELETREAANLVARALLTSVLAPVHIAGQDCRVTASIGIATYPDDAQEGVALMKCADMAMYHAKQEGKNNSQFYSQAIGERSNERVQIETCLRGALERGELSLHYQAKKDLKTDEIRGVEALLRWSSPQLGSVPPAQFIPIAEDCGLIVSIGRWAMTAACAQSVEWLRQGLPPLCMAVNLSPRQFLDPSLVDNVRRALVETGIPPSLLELEVTESVMIHDGDAAIAKLVAIRELGVRIAIDDFGTGYSSLSQLRRFPINTLKIDRSFIRGIPDNHEDMAIAEAILAVGRALAVTVVAEGVETADQQAFLNEHACDEMQGFYFSRPSTPDQFAALLRAHTPSPATGA